MYSNIHYKPQQRYTPMKMISLRLNDKELEALEAAAAGDKLKLTTWIKQAAMKAADRERMPPPSNAAAEVLPQGQEPLSSD